MIQVVGHSNPDSDSICSSLVAAEWLKISRSVEAVAVAQGEVTGETAFILNEAGVEAPALCESVEGKKVWLVDFTDLGQGPEGLDKADIMGVIDHHRLGDLTTVNPLEMWIWPVGCSSTILFNLFRMESVKIERSVAILMLGAIISDTVAFRSPTCTDKDREAARLLAEEAGISLYDFADRLLRAKTNLDGLTIDSLVDRDLKQYAINGANVVVGQLEIASFEQVEDKMEALDAELQARCVQGGFKLAALMLTDITSSTTRLLVQGEWAEKLKSDSADRWVQMEDTLSRKKQAWPWIQKTLAA
ncbi:manganese-dependent inorganic pyrophosphatase [Endozoicomonas gorgoniicola]|uniref:inorganic diphosphatase n=1 Tax=Endozoicomonas gorgoniicola TaxID=1234144 RepID=A0ABT3N0Z3_9GAMM|nr:manganese-dependent inorganic pyrophosphatase [Endozoicomonas gorgoniicola]MCW7555308.1 manganese-dependent inorganic pyrophosphatase [Endozoicomonas gorgoniicola]